MYHVISRPRVEPDGKKVYTTVAKYHTLQGAQALSIKINAEGKQIAYVTSQRG